MMCWNWMNYGHLWAIKGTNAGYGLLCADAPARLLLILLAIVVKKVVGDFGSGCQSHIVTAKHSAISGRLIKLYLVLWPANINRLERKQAKRLTWSGGTTHFGNAWHDSFAKPCLFLNRTSIMRLRSSCSFTSTMWRSSVNY